MALDYAARYLGRASNPVAGVYPTGCFKNETSVGAKDGTPLNKDWQNDFLGTRDATLRRGRITANGDIETAEESQVLNALVRIAHETGTRPQNAVYQDICTDVPTSEWYSPSRAPNVVSAGGTIIDSCIGYNRAADLHRILVLTSGGDILPIGEMDGDYSAAPSVGGAIAFAYPSTPDDVQAICSDGDYVYSAWSNTGGNLKVTKFNSVSFAAEWTADTGIAASPGAPVSMIHSRYSGRVILATKSEAFGYSNRIIVAINTSTAAVLSGTGTWSSGNGDTCGARNAQIVSDGDHVFWIQSQESAPNIQFYLASAKISDPTTSDYSNLAIHGSLTLASPWTHPRGIIRVGQDILTITPNGYINAFSTVDETYYPVYHISPTQGPFYEGGQDAIFGFDGMNVWAMGVIVDNDTPTPRTSHAMFKIPAGGLTHKRYVAGYDAITPSSVIINTTILEESYRSGKILFDGFDIWEVTRYGSLYRVVNPGLR